MSNDKLSRRNAVRGIGALGTVGALGGVSALLSQGASATAGGEISDPNVFTSSDGTVDWVSIQVTGRLNWNGFDDPVGEFRILSDVELKRNGNTLWSGRINDTGKVDATQGSDWGNSGEEIVLNGDYDEGRAGYIASDAGWGVVQRNRDNIYNNGYGLPENPAPAAPLYSNTDGSTVDTRIIVKSTYILYGKTGQELTGQSGYPERPQSSSSFVVSLNNESSSTNFGNSDAEGDTDNTVDVGIGNS
jgi:hypothetical protein